MSIALKQDLAPVIATKSPSKRSPKVVYNAKVEDLIKKVTLHKESAMTVMTADWMLFMDKMNHEMFKKIS